MRDMALKSVLNVTSVAQRGRQSFWCLCL